MCTPKEREELLTYIYIPSILNDYDGLFSFCSQKFLYASILMVIGVKGMYVSLWQFGGVSCTQRGLFLSSMLVRDMH